MSLIKKAFYYIGHPKQLSIALYNKRMMGKYGQSLSDEEYIKKMFKKRMGVEPNLIQPKTFCEKLNWLKLHDRKPIYTTMADKYLAKELANSKGLKVVPLLGVYDNFDEIDFDALPNQFVLKTNHTSGGYVICKDKAKFDVENARKVLNKSLKTDYYLTSREWPYKDIKRKIIAEEYIDSLGKPESVEYKVTCFNGKVEFITVCRGIAHSEYKLRKNDFYDKDFNFLPFVTTYYENSHVENPKPKFLKELIEQSELMAKDTYYLRVDFYDIDGELVFGEATFFTWAGFIKFDPPEYDQILGDRLLLPTDQIK